MKLTQIITILSILFIQSWFVIAIELLHSERSGELSTASMSSDTSSNDLVSIGQKESFSIVTPEKSMIAAIDQNLRPVAQQPTNLVTYKSASTQMLFNGFVRKDYVQGSQSMLQKGFVSIDASNPLEENQLHAAARNNSYKMINFLIKKDRLNINQKNLKEQTPLCVAAKSRSYNAVTVLVDAGADVNAQDTTGRTALHWACDNEGIVSKSRAQDGDAIVKFLSMLDRIVLEVKDYNGQVPLHVAVLSKRYVALQELCDTGALLDEQDNNGQTPLHIAVLQGDARSVEILLKAGASIDIVDFAHNIPVQYAMTPEIIDLFAKSR